MTHVRPAIGPVLAAMLLLPLPAAAADTDGDGLRDRFELRGGVTDPQMRDSDGDGVADTVEDSDGDKLGNLGEQRFGTDPADRDSDDDGIPDGREDHDGDGRINLLEQDQRPLPADLRPTLARAGDDHPLDRARCLSKRGDADVKRCWFGHPESDTTIALVGDSHAMSLVPGFKAAVELAGWRLVTQVKGSCAPYLGVGASSRDCRRWRRDVLDWLQEREPDLIVFTHSDDYRLRHDGGTLLPASRRPKAWKLGLWRTMAELPAESHVLVLGDVPDNRKRTLGCLARNRDDMSRCATRRVPAEQRAVEDALRRGALAAGASHRTLYDQLCPYDPCPLVHGNVLVYRDEGHLTRTFSRRMAPSMRVILAETLAQAASTETLAQMASAETADADPEVSE